jgi:NDP-sugar pyrophosphorylase family protein
VTAAPLCGGIIAAGEGSRLRADGFRMPKPLVPVAGVPLIERALGNLFAVGVTAPVVIVNEDGRSCVDWVRERFRGHDIEFIVKTTASSLESFHEVSRRLPAARSVISTVDAWCPVDEFRRFVSAALRRPAEVSVLAVTPLVADEKPLWVDADDDGRLRFVGGASGSAVTAGVYMLSARARAAAPPPLGRLRDFLAWLHAQGEPMYAETIEAVVDVDRASDVALAEALQAGNNDRTPSEVSIEGC